MYITGYNGTADQNKLFFFLLELSFFSVRYGEIRAFLEGKGKVIGAMDMLIAAHAGSLGLTLATNNLREFQRVPGLEVENWV